MKVIVQRVKEASVKVENKIVGKIGYGYMLLVSFTKKDNLDIINYMVKKIVNLRIMDDENKVMNKSILDIKGSILSVSQFTLYADTKKGNRPSYIKALNGDEAIKLYDLFIVSIMFLISSSNIFLRSFQSGINIVTKL